MRAPLSSADGADQGRGQGETRHRVAPSRPTFSGPRRRFGRRAKASSSEMTGSSEKPAYHPDGAGARPRCAHRWPRDLARPGELRVKQALELWPAWRRVRPAASAIEPKPSRSKQAGEPDLIWPTKIRGSEDAGRVELDELAPAPVLAYAIGDARDPATADQWGAGPWDRRTCPPEAPSTARQRRP